MPQIPELCFLCPQVWQVKVRPVVFWMCYFSIFECQSYCSNSEIVTLRNELQNIQELEVNFDFKILFSDDLNLYTRKIFFSLYSLEDIDLLNSY